MNESLKELKAIVDNAPRCGEAAHIDDDGDYIMYGEIHDYYYSEKLSRWIPTDGVRVTRSLSDIERIIELMEQVKCVRNETLSDLCHAIEPDGAINSEQGVNTIRAIQRAIMRLIDE